MSTMKFQNNLEEEAEEGMWKIFSKMVMDSIFFWRRREKIQSISTLQEAADESIVSPTFRQAQVKVVKYK